MATAATTTTDGGGGNANGNGAAKDLGAIETSPQDDRSYRAIELPNGLQVRGCGFVALWVAGLYMDVRTSAWGVQGANWTELTALQRACDRPNKQTNPLHTTHRRCSCTTRTRTRRPRRWTSGSARSSTGTWRAARTSASTCSSSVGTSVGGFVGWVGGWDLGRGWGARGAYLHVYPPV